VLIRSPWQAGIGGGGGGGGGGSRRRRSMGGSCMEGGRDGGICIIDD